MRDARQLPVQIGKEAKIVVTLTKYTKADSVGVSKKEAYDIEGNLLINASLTGDNLQIIPSKGMQSQKYTLFGKHIEKKDVIYTDRDGNILPVASSTYYIGVTLEKAISIISALSMDVESSYVLEGEEAGLKALYQVIQQKLVGNEVFSFEYTYYDSPSPQTAILLPLENKIILLIGNIETPEWNRLTTIKILDELPDEEEDISFEEVW